MISKSMQKALSKQINEELASAYIYLDLSNQAAEMNYEGVSKWFYVQWQEELVHAMKFRDFIHDLAGEVVMADLKMVSKKHKSLVSMFEAAYQHECHISKCIHDLCALAQKENDYPTLSMLNWFVDEQVEEEANTKLIVDKLTMIGDRGEALYMIDKELGGRSDEESA